MIKYLEYIISRPNITTTLIILTNSILCIVGYYGYNLNIKQLIVVCLLSITTTLISYVKGLRAGRLFSVLEFKKDVVDYSKKRDFTKEYKEIMYHKEDNL